MLKFSERDINKGKMSSNLNSPHVIIQQDVVRILRTYQTNKSGLLQYPCKINYTCILLPDLFLRVQKLQKDNNKNNLNFTQDGCLNF